MTDCSIRIAANAYGVSGVVAVTMLRRPGCKKVRQPGRVTRQYLGVSLRFDQPSSLKETLELFVVITVWRSYDVPVEANQELIRSCADGMSLQTEFLPYYEIQRQARSREIHQEKAHSDDLHAIHHA